MNTTYREVGVDWLTATSTSDQAAELMNGIFSQMLRERAIPKSFIVDAGFQGYYGVRVDEAFYGSRKDGDCVILSGSTARRWAREFIEVGARASRLDLQVTLDLAERREEFLLHAFRAAKAFKPANGRLWDLKGWIGREGLQGFYVGRRSSEVFLRLYDKQVESKEKWYQGCIRAEVELKRFTARRYGPLLVNAPDEALFCQDTVLDFYTQKGIELPMQRGSTPLVEVERRQPTPVEAKMAWLRMQVAPTVQALIDIVGEGAVASVFFPDRVQDTLNHDKMGSGMFDARS